MSQVAVIGSLNYDMFLTLSDVPRIGETANASALKTAAGGKGANQAVQVVDFHLLDNKPHEPPL